MKKILSIVGMIFFAIILISCQEVSTPSHTVTEVIDAISIVYAQGDSADSVTENLTLPLASDLEKTAVITWDSNQVSVVDHFGTINRQNEDTQVTLTLSVTLGSDSAQKFFDITVLGTIVYHTVTFDVNGDLTTQNIADGSRVDRPDDLSNPNFRFNGWFADVEKTIPFDFYNVITQDVTIYASYDAILIGNYTIEIYLENLEDEAYTLYSTTEYTSEAGLTVTLDYNQNGFVLNVEDSTLSGVVDSESDTVLKGYFDRRIYTISFYDGSTLISSDMLKYETLTSTISDPVKDNYNFLGWSTTPSGITYYNFGQAITNNVILYAQWEYAGTFTYEGYYEGADGLTGTTLKSFLNTVVNTGFVGVTYGDARYMLDDTDRDPNNSNNVILLYLGTSVSGTWDGGITWNREHVWPQSWLGVSASNGTANAASDLHNLKPADPGTNSSRGNKYFANTTTSTTYAPRDEVKGDIARILFYMTVMYSNLELVNSYNSVVYQMGMLDILLQWHLQDPVDSFEQTRNNIIFNLQHNRNPFIDHPEFVEKLWGPITLSNNTSIFLNVETNRYLLTNNIIADPQTFKKSYIM